MDTLTKIRAAMFAAIGTKTKFSRAGHSVVFVEPVCGRHDLSGLTEEIALTQAKAAGLDLDALTPEQIEAYQAWHDHMYQTRRINGARILITRPYSAQRLHGPVPVNAVRLIDGWDTEIDSAVIDMLIFRDAKAINQIGQRGAYRQEPDMAAIDEFIAMLRKRHPEFSRARVQDNNVKSCDE